MSNTITPTVFYRTLNVEELEIFYREAGPRDAPTVLLLHGFPSSSHMFRNLIPMLADKYHVVAPDFPGYGESSAPSVNDFDYSYERLAIVTEKFTEKLNISSYALYLSDIGASIGFRLAVMHPERVTALIVQNGEAHFEAFDKEFSKGLFHFWEDRSEKNAQVLRDWLLTIEGTKWHYLHGVRDASRISPDNWVIDQANQDRPGNKDIQLSILYNAKGIWMPMPTGRSISANKSRPCSSPGAQMVESSRSRALSSIRESFPTQSFIFLTRAISHWKKKRIGLGR
jgi:pimeloyl-ACP methyl ester carboxylesterase